MALHIGADSITAALNARGVPIDVRRTRELLRLKHLDHGKMGRLIVCSDEQLEASIERWLGDTRDQAA